MHACVCMYECMDGWMDGWMNGCIDDNSITNQQALAWISGPPNISGGGQCPPIFQCTPNELVLYIVHTNGGLRRSLNQG